MNIRPILRAALAPALLLNAAAALAAEPAPMNTEFKDGCFIFSVFTNNDLEVTYDPTFMGSGSCSDGVTIQSPESLVIPAEMTFEGYTYPVTSIGPDGFGNLTGLKEITLPSTLKWIRSSAFENCRALREIVIPDNVWRIDNAAFKDCMALQEVVVPYSVTRMDQSAFQGCHGLETIVNLADMTGSYKGALTGLTSDPTVYLPMESLALASGWKGRISCLGPYFGSVEAKEDHVRFGSPKAHDLDVEVLEVAVGGTKAAKNANGEFEATGLQPDQDYQVGLVCRVGSNLYRDSFAVHTLPGSGVGSLEAVSTEARTLRLDGTAAAGNERGLVIMVDEKGRGRIVLRR